MGITALLYHLVGTNLSPEKTSYFVPKETLYRQWLWLKRWGYNSITVYQLYLAQQGKITLPLKPLLLTFDDGYQDTFAQAMPVAESLGLKLTAFITAGKLGDPVGIVGTCGEGYPLMSAKDLQKMVAKGHDIQSHGLTHTNLPGLDDTSLRHELKGSRKILEEAIGREVVALAYPHGKTDERVMRFCAETGYYLGFLSKKDKQGFSNKNLAIERISINRYHPAPLILKLRLAFRRKYNT